MQHLPSSSSWCCCFINDSAWCLLLRYSSSRLTEYQAAMKTLGAIPWSIVSVLPYICSVVKAVYVVIIIIIFLIVYLYRIFQYIWLVYHYINEIHQTPLNPSLWRPPLLRFPQLKILPPLIFHLSNPPYPKSLPN